MLLQIRMVWVKFPSFPNKYFRPSSCSISGKVQTTSERSMRHLGFSQGAGRCWPVHSFSSKQPRAAILSHQSHSTCEATEHRDMWKAGAGAQQSFRCLLSTWCEADVWAGREQQGPAQAFGSRPPLFFCHSLNFLFHFVLKQWWWVLYRYLVPRKWREFWRSSDKLRILREQLFKQD